MKMPTNKVPLSSKWQTLRNKSGGDKGLAKVSISKSLTDFHADIQKAERSGDNEVAIKAMDALKKNLKLYDAAISKSKECIELVSTLRREVLSPFTAFCKAFDQAVAKEVTRVENYIQNVTGMVIKEGGKLNTEFKAINKEMSVMSKKYAQGVPAEDKENLVRFMKNVHPKCKNAKVGLKALDDALDDLVDTHADYHRPELVKYKATLGKARKVVTDTRNAAKQASAYLTGFMVTLKKKKG